MEILLIVFLVSLAAWVGFGLIMEQNFGWAFLGTAFVSFVAMTTIGSLKPQQDAVDFIVSKRHKIEYPDGPWKVGYRINTVTKDTLWFVTNDGLEIGPQDEKGDVYEMVNSLNSTEKQSLSELKIVE